MTDTRLSLCLLLALASGAAFARQVVVPALPPPEFADTEVSTNRPFATNREGSQVLTLRIDFAATRPDRSAPSFWRTARWSS